MTISSIFIDIKGWLADQVTTRNVMYARHGVAVTSCVSEDISVVSLGTYTFSGVSGNSLTVVRSTSDFSLSITNANGTLNLGVGRLFVLPTVVSVTVTNPGLAAVVISFLHG